MSAHVANAMPAKNMTAKDMTARDMTARDEILCRIREALPGEPVDPAASHSRIERRYECHGALVREQVVELFVDRLLDYDTDIHQIDSEIDGEACIASAISKALGQRNESSVLVPEAFPESWLPKGVTLVRDMPLTAPLTVPQLDAESAVVTTCEAAVASTGTIFLMHSGAQGRRALTLLPDHHICIVRRDQVYETVSEAMAAVAPHVRKPITTISGPSATSDIEMTRIRGVHGPRELTVILYGRA